ncbi:LptE family protein [Flavobacterium sp. RHBU_24]|uniref:LptE family protein n=1 Tax=Flavobacterium sp. RHBU_24 TaxID=3391185 RepID=UPI00398538F8
MRILKIIVLCLLLPVLGCGSSNNKYNLNGISVGEDVKTFQVNNFRNNAEVVEPGIDRTFTQRLQELVKNQTRLTIDSSSADLVYEGEITQFRVTPMTATANQRASQNRLTVTVNVRFTNNKNSKYDFENQFSFYHDYDANKLLTGATLSNATDEIFERITQDIFNESLGKW